MDKTKVEVFQFAPVGQDGVNPNLNKKQLDQVPEMILLKHYSIWSD